MKDPEIRHIEPIKLIGMKTMHSLSNNKTELLWNQFMQRRKDIKNRINNLFYSVQVYPEGIPFSAFTDKTEFTIWAAVEINDFINIPNSLDKLTIAGGLYAIFTHKGPAATFPQTFQYILTKWLPNSIYELDEGMHFEVMGKNYISHIDPDSEEDVYIPIRKKSTDY